MNKLYISPSGAIKVIDVPEEPASPIRHMIVETEIEYEQSLAAAKEAGIELCTDNLTAKQLFDFLADIGIEGVESHQWLEKHKGDIIDLPKGWKVEIKNECPTWCSDCKAFDWSTCKEKQVAVLLPPVSEKVESQEELTDAEFCRMYNEFHGEEIDNIKQLVRASFTGEELKEFIDHCLKFRRPD